MNISELILKTNENITEVYKRTYEEAEKAGITKGIEIGRKQILAEQAEEAK